MQSTKGMIKIMKGMLTLALVAFSLTFTTQAFAQEIPEPEPIPEETAPEPAPQPEAPSAELQQLEAALADIDAEVVALTGVTELAPENVQVIAVTDLTASDPDAATRVTEAVTAQNEQILALQQALGAHAAAATALDAAGASVDQVVAAHVDGSNVVLFYQ